MPRIAIVNPQAPVALGDTYSFFPSCWTGESPGGREAKARPLVGRVIDVNRAHRHFTVAAELRGAIIRESFKF